MLTHLSIQNLAVVKTAKLDFLSGFSVITGETGAGKSIAIDSLALCLGARADASMVRTGAKQANIEAYFDLSQRPTAQRWLADEMLEDDDENACVIRRVVNAEGRSKAFINGHTVSLAQLKQLTSQLLSIHGQHAHYDLLKGSAQLAMLDRFGRYPQLLNDVAERYQQYRTTEKQLQAAQHAQQTRVDRLQLLTYQLDELDQFNLGVDEFTQLEVDFKRLSNSQHLLQASQAIYFRLASADDHDLLSSLQSCIRSLDQLADLDDSLRPLLQQFIDAQVQLEDASNELRHYVEHLDVDPLHIQQVTERYEQAIDLARKHQVQPEFLAETHAQLTKEHQQLQQAEHDVSELEAQLHMHQEAYLAAANTLHTHRCQAAEQFAAQLQNAIREMNMPKANIELIVSKQSEQVFHAKGFDQVQIKVSTNPGQALDSLDKVVSGGELSRIGLAIQVLTSHPEDVPTLIFDEVDTGISGPTASIVGGLLRRLGQLQQVLAVTHLPQVAAQGHNHYLVQKASDEQATETDIHHLQAAQREQELARLLAGGSVSQSALANARDLLSQVT